MKSANFVVDVLIIADFFNNVVDCFEYVQIDRNFDQSYQTDLLKLDDAKLRLSRWDQFVDLNHELKDTQSLFQILKSTQKVNKIEQILNQILKFFANAEDISIKFKIKVEKFEQKLFVHNSQVNLKFAALILHNKMRDLSIKRQNQTNLRQKTKWTLYEKKHFKRFIENITNFVDDLIELFSTVQASQQNFCTIEMTEMNAKKNLSMLKIVVQSQNKLLEKTIVKARNSRSSTTSNISFSDSQNSKFQLANNTRTINNLRWDEIA